MAIILWLCSQSDCKPHATLHYSMKFRNIHRTYAEAGIHETILWAPRVNQRWYSKCVCACVFGLCNATHSIAIRRIYTFQWAFRLWAIHSTRWHASIQNSEIICSEFLCDHRCRACHRLSLCLLSMRLHGELLSICHKTDVSCYKNWCYVLHER